MKRFLCGLLAPLFLFAGLLTACGETPAAGSQGYSVATLSAVGDIFLTEEMLADARTAGGDYDFSAQLAEIVPAVAFFDM